MMIPEHSKIKVGFDLEIWEHYSCQMGIYIDLHKSLHWLITGNSGSGKSYLVQQILRNILMEYKGDVKLWILDFKNSSDYAYLSGYPLYYTGEACSKGLSDFYAEYQKVKNGEIKDGRLRLLIFDEMAGFQIWQTQQDKKLAEKYSNYLLEILLMGRSMLCGIFSIMQRPDSKYIPGREQFMVYIALGKLSLEFKKMIMQGDDLEQKPVYDVGEGIIKTDYFGTKFLKVPRIRNLQSIHKQIISCLESFGMFDSYGAARGGEVSLSNDSHV